MRTRRLQAEKGRQPPFLCVCPFRSHGVGVSVSPYILSLVISGEQGWRGGYRAASGIQLCIAAVLLFTLPIWKKGAWQ